MISYLPYSHLKNEFLIILFAYTFFSIYCTVDDWINDFWKLLFYYGVRQDIYKKLEFTTIYKQPIIKCIFFLLKTQKERCHMLFRGYYSSVVILRPFWKRISNNFRQSLKKITMTLTISANRISFIIFCMEIIKLLRYFPFLLFFPPWFFLIFLSFFFIITIFFFYFFFSLSFFLLILLLF